MYVYYILGWYPMPPHRANVWPSSSRSGRIHHRARTITRRMCICPLKVALTCDIHVPHHTREFRVSMPRNCVITRKDAPEMRELTICVMPCTSAHSRCFQLIHAMILLSTSLIQFIMCTAYVLPHYIRIWCFCLLCVFVVCLFLCLCFFVFVCCVLVFLLFVGCVLLFLACCCFCLPLVPQQTCCVRSHFGASRSRTIGHGQTTTSRRQSSSASSRRSS